MRILAIETSCDETAVAIVEASSSLQQPADRGFPDVTFHVLGSALLSQIALHQQYGGVYPAMAKREHAANIIPVLEEALDQAGLLHAEYSNVGPEREKFAQLFSHEEGLADTVCMFLSRIRVPDIQAICVTAGPGLEPTLWVGINLAKALGMHWNLPVIPVNHMEGHFLSSLVKNDAIQNVELPILGLLISGGHTELVSMKKWLRYEVIGTTLDDAVGEAFDKTARLLGLPYPGGPQISRLAESARKQNLESNFKLPRPMMHSGDLNFSFSGLKTAVLYTVKKIEHVTDEIKMMLAREFEDAVTDVCISKVRKAIEQTGARSFLIGGGVAANTHIRRELTKLIEFEFPETAIYLPDISITGDNAIMIAQASLMHLMNGEQSRGGDIRADGNLSFSKIQK